MELIPSILFLVLYVPLLTYATINAVKFFNKCESLTPPKTFEDCIKDYEKLIELNCAPPETKGYQLTNYELHLEKYNIELEGQLKLLDYLLTEEKRRRKLAECNIVILKTHVNMLNNTPPMYRQLMSYFK